MKKTLVILAIVILVAIVIVAYVINRPAGLGAGADASFNRMGGLTAYSTTTAAALPVKLLASDSTRRYAIISNPSDTAIYLWFTTDTWTLDGSGTPATSTITALDGVYLASHAVLELGPDNLVYGNIWVSSTAASKQINVSYK